MGTNRKITRISWVLHPAIFGRYLTIRGVEPLIGLFPHIPCKVCIRGRMKALEKAKVDVVDGWMILWTDGLIFEYDNDLI